MSSILVISWVYELIIIFGGGMSSSEENPGSQSEASEQQQRSYTCFCSKVFTTYPGIYLHLKSKHNTLFLKYKKLKITKLFRKTKGSNGSEIYRLEQLPQKQSTNKNFCQKKKIKQQIKHKNEEKEGKESLENGAGSPKVNLGGHQPARNVEQEDEHIQGIINSKILQNQKAEAPEMVATAPYYPGYFNPPFLPPPPPFFGHYPYGNPFAFRNIPTMKKLMGKYLEECELELGDRVSLKNALYNLMVFLDKNSHLLNDPFVKNRLFLSFCDQFEPRTAAFLIHDYLMHVRTTIEFQKLKDSERREKRLELHFLRKFIQWLMESAYLDYYPIIEAKDEKQEKSTSPKPREKGSEAREKGSEASKKDQPVIIEIQEGDENEHLSVE